MVVGVNDLMICNQNLKGQACICKSFHLSFWLSLFLTKYEFYYFVIHMHEQVVYILYTMLILRQCN